ncbi:glutamine-hydrolyzing carbamoyl-phosphate synthase small subunit [Phaeovibrio sulfidiphilus]|uniref:Carbamoyl phosphate synthase small chain n=1 Tax=Phaeovibrio sulfidiphilus TaxID=1220600 RepID=A0A8J6YVA0_9PROT|nr:glutamine-hydrolyzing carbamoyl-phosphate synthase small subunit [Phaeovibrio sulfidiphilus]MBE1236387.1 glutamine-hydrolyzing carbamoyl-phosphate synthase small subunit [Phaeovibrio sulfidiphilus]
MTDHTSNDTDPRSEGPDRFPRPPGATAVLALEDGTLVWGRGAGASGEVVGEVCFNTAMSGCQEILTDPSYHSQILTFCFPHAGGTGANPEDMEADVPAVRGAVFRAALTTPSNWRATVSLNDWLVSRGIVALCGVDTRALTARIRTKGALCGVLAHNPDGVFDPDALFARARSWSGLAGLDLASAVSTRESYTWDQTLWSWKDGGYGRLESPRHHVVVVDYGVKRNMLRSLASLGCRVTVVPCTTPAADILALNPDGIVLSSGPGDPAATAVHAAPVIRELLASGKPLMGVCLGHQLLALALGAKTVKMELGHRGANHPVKDLTTGRVEITSMNHGFVVDRATLPAGVVETHTSLFDGVLEGLAVEGKPVFSVQYHPEASPGPGDSHHLFRRFADLLAA